MKISIRTKFTLGNVAFFVIISLLSILSAIYLTRLSKKTSAILKENHFSVIYARDMSESLTGINQEITTSFLTSRNPDSMFIKKELKLFDKSLQLEKNNITETGEDKLASGIETGFTEYRNSVVILMKSPKQVAEVLSLQKKFDNLYQQLMLLSQINEEAIQIKTNDAKLSAKNALTQMTIVGAVCFLIALSFTYSFSVYFNERFSQLYNGIKEIGSSNYDQRLYFDGKDEFYEISLVFNEMAEKLSESNQKIALTLQEDSEKDLSLNDIQELKMILIRMKNIEEQAVELISKLENKN
jgi:methyl-accepting chemotaxis protein